MTKNVYRSAGVAGLVASVLLVWSSSALAQPSSDVPTVSVTRAAGGRVLVEVADALVTIRKEVAGTSSHVAITTRTDAMQLRVAGGEVVLSTPKGTVALNGRDPSELGAMLTLLRQSDAAAKGLALLQRVPASARDFGQQSLLLTRAVLELGAGTSDAVATHRRLSNRERIQSPAGRPSGFVVTRTALAAGLTQGPGDCWDAYAKEAVRIADDFADCSDDLKWYDALGWAGCSLIYTVRAEAAMAWFIACNGGMPFKA